MAKIINFRPNKELRKATFQKYRSPPDMIKIYQQVEVLTSSHDCPPVHDSRRETRLSGFHNHLYRNPYTGIYWFWNEHETLYCLKPNGRTDAIVTIKSKGKSNYNSSMVFVDENILVLSNGYGLMILYRTDDHEDPMMSCDFNGGIVVDATFIKDKGVIKIAISCIFDINEKKKTKIVILTYSINPPRPLYTQLVLGQKQEFICDGVVDYVHIESTGDYINIISAQAPRLGFDSLDPKLCWSQNEDSVTAWLLIPETYENSKPMIHISPNLIRIKFEQTVLLQGPCQYPLNTNTVVWNRKKNILKVQLLKKETGRTWHELIANNSTCGDCLPNDLSESEIFERLMQLSNRQIENNDQLMSDLNKAQQNEPNLKRNQKCLRRINLKNYVITHAAVLDAQNRLIFTENSLLNPLLLIKHGADACVWKINEAGDDWNISHVATFPNFADVANKKIHTKFCLVPPDCGYIAIVEHSQYAFIYEKPAQKQTIGKQKLVDLGENALPFIGAVATNNYLMLLTREKLRKFKIVA